MDVEQARVEHLKLIEAVIDRLSRLSFAVKAAASTLVAALIIGTLSADAPLVAIGAVAIPVLWFIDGYYLRQEKLYRQLFLKVRTSPPAEPSSAEYFDMDARPYSNHVAGIQQIMFRTYLGLYYTVLLVFVLGAAIATLTSTID